MKVNRSWIVLASLAALMLPGESFPATSGEPLPPDEEARRRRASDQGEEWAHSVPEDSPGPSSGTGPLGVAPVGPDVVPEDSPGPLSGTVGGVPLPEDREDVPEDSPGPRSGTGPDGLPLPETGYEVPEDSPGRDSGR